MDKLGCTKVEAEETHKHLLSRVWDATDEPKWRNKTYLMRAKYSLARVRDANSYLEELEDLVFDIDTDWCGTGSDAAGQAREARWRVEFDAFKAKLKARLQV